MCVNPYVDDYIYSFTVEKLMKIKLLVEGNYGKKQFSALNQLRLSMFLYEKEGEGEGGVRGRG